MRVRLKGPHLGFRYCGQDPPPQVTSSDYTMTIRFKSDHSVAHDGFMANYVLVNASTVCGANYLTEVGLLQSPGYPVRYPPGKSCVWTIRVPVGQQIMLNVTDFDLENGTGSGCPYDFLEIRNGGLQTSPLVGKFCGGTYLPPRLIPSSSNSLYLKFSTDSSRSGRGFRILWDGTSTGCGSTLKGPSGSLVSNGNYSILFKQLASIHVLFSGVSKLSVQFRDSNRVRLEHSRKSGQCNSIHVCGFGSPA